MTTSNRSTPQRVIAERNREIDAEFAVGNRDDNGATRDAFVCEWAPPGWFRDGAVARRAAATALRSLCANMWETAVTNRASISS